MRAPSFDEIKAAINLDVTAQPKARERWRFVIEGTVASDQRDGAGGHYVSVLTETMPDGKLWSQNVYLGACASMDRLPDPEPRWQAGDVVRSATGVALVCLRDGQRLMWDAPLLGSRYELDVPARPLTRLVPEVQS